MGLAAIGSVVFAVMAPITLHLFTDAIPKFCRIAVSRAAKRLPQAIRRNQENAWLADFAVLETDLERLRCVVGCWSTSITVRWPFALEKTEHDLLVARKVLKLHGAIAWYAIGRIKAWNTSSDAEKWSFAEKCMVGILLQSGTSLPRSFKAYFLRIEDDIKARPHEFATKEEFTKEIVVPIYREVQLIKFLNEHNLSVIPD